MWLRFAPLRLPARRRLQTAAVLQWVFSFLALAQCCLGLFLLLLLGDGWLVALGYAAWLYLDWETPSRGGRRSAWVRGWAVWRYFRDYFPITLVKTAQLDPSRNYVFGFHPHGVLVAGAFGNFCTEATGFSRLFPGLTPHLLMLPFWFKVPFFRDYIMSGGLVSSEKASASYLLGHEGGGQVAVIAVGGPPESLDARPGALTLQLRSRKGFIKMALRHGAALVPVFSFGENELFNQVPNPQGSVIRRLQERLQRAMGLALPLFHARGVFQYNFGLLPFRRPIYTVVGAPITVPKMPDPSPEAIDELHETYLEKLTQLFEEQKAKPAGKMTLRRHLEALSVLQWVLSFLFFGLFFSLLLVCLLFTSFWCLSVLYFAWWVVDLDTPVQGGRRSEWVRRWKVWELHRDYFPIKLVKTAELPPGRNYVLGSHPHGIICAGAFSAFGTEACGFSRAFPGLTSSLALLAGLFYLPVYREYMMSSGMVPVSKRSLESLLRAGPGHALVIVVGGATESLDCNPGEQRLHLSSRRGFVRLALQHGADLVPVFSFGENDIFRQVQFREGSLLRRLQLRFKQLTGFAPCLFVGRSLFFSRCWGLLPQRSPITVVVGKPIPVPLRPHPKPEEVDHYHGLYVQALQKLFEEHKGSCGLPPSQQLCIT